MLEILRHLVRIILRILYRVEVQGIENFHRAGKRVLIIANHVSFLDGVLLAAFLPRLPLFVINTFIASKWWVKPFLRPIKHITIDPTNPLYVKTLIRTIEGSELVAIFPEGRITVTGSLMKIYQGSGLVVDKTGARVLPIRLDGPQYSKFSRLQGVVRQRWFPRIRITILPSRTIDIDPDIRGSRRRAITVRLLEDMMRDMVFISGRCHQTLFESLLEARTIHGGTLPIIEDVNRRQLSYTQLLRSVFGLSCALRGSLKDRTGVGLMLPNAIATVVTFLASHLLGKTPSMINYTMGIKDIRSAIRTASIGTIITSRKFIEALGRQDAIEAVAHDADIIYLEDVKESITVSIKLKAFLSGLFPRLAWSLSQATDDPQESAVILFTSGSEGEPKGVVLSHTNLLANRCQLDAVLPFTANDVILNAMPLFHSFGFTAGMVLPLTNGVRFFLYPSPLHYNIIPGLAYDIRCTILFGTNTFLAGYAQKAHAYDFHTVRLLLAGAEKLQEETQRIWYEKFGLRIFEGYGATETSPVISVNTPIHYKAGTAGRLLPGIEYHLEPVAGIEEGGRLHVKGMNVMSGYLMPDEPGVLQPPSTLKGDGWYDTGDIVCVDDMNFVAIKGRAKRFAKIAGEMISLIQVENLARCRWPDADHAVVAIPDVARGEQLVLFSTRDITDRSRMELLEMAHQMGQSELLVPRNMTCVDGIPLLATGKTDYTRLLDMAFSRFN